MVDTGYYPPIAFHFRVEVGNSIDSFQVVSGLEAEIEIETVREGGLNNSVHKLPKGVKYPNLILKRGLLLPNSDLLQWVSRSLLEEANFDDFETQDVLVALMNESGEDVMSWNIKKAYPVKWSVSEFDAQKNALVIESIELAYQSFAVEDDGGLKRIIRGILKG